MSIPGSFRLTSESASLKNSFSPTIQYIRGLVTSLLRNLSLSLMEVSGSGGDWSRLLLALASEAESECSGA